MRPRHHWFADRHHACRRAAERGATLVEYALVVSLVVVVSLAAFERLTEVAGDEVDNQAACVSTRPAPVGAGCNVSPFPPDIETPNPNVVPIPPNLPPEARAPVLSAAAPRVTDEGGQWRVEWPITLVLPGSGEPAPPDEPLGGVQLTGYMLLPVPNSSPLAFQGTQHFTNCTTNASGTCDLTFVIGNEHEAVRIVFSGANHSPSPSADSFPDRRTLDRPE
jgi:Flp pilus assembly pilin Flp